jgi:hypothetical protein
MFGITRRRLAKWVVDTLTIVLLSTVATAPMELAVVGLTFEQMANARWRGAVVNILTGGFYGQFRDWIYEKKFRADKGGRVRKYFAELTAFGLFQVPLYVLVLMITRADVDQIIRGCGFALAVSPVAAPVLDWCMVYLRRWLGVEKRSS